MASKYKKKIASNKKEEEELNFLSLFLKEREILSLFGDFNRTVYCSEQDLRSSLTNLTFKTTL